MTEFNENIGNKSIRLSVVVIARNEEHNIARAIESILRGVAHWPQTEILLVDSASTDETVEIAKRYPINIVRLKPSWFLSAAAGRYIGTCYTEGDFILFLDGDMELEPEWLDRSIPYAIEHAQVAAISGFRRDVYMSNGQIVREEEYRRDPQGRVLETEFLSGALLCRRSAIQQVGGFLPFIKSEEEVDLSIRLRHYGFKLVRLPYLICRHYCIPMVSLAGSLRRFRLNLWLGYGQLPRYYLGTRLFWVYLKGKINTLAFLAAIFLSLITILLTLYFGNIVFFAAWLLVVFMAIMVLSILKRSLSQALLSVLIHTLITYSSVRGFLMAPRPQEEYPTDVEIIQKIVTTDVLPAASI